MVMKRFCFSALAAAAAIAALPSCNGKLSSTTYDSDASFPAAEGSEYALEVRISAEYPVSGLKKAALDNIDKVLTATLFGDEYAAMEPEKAIEAYKADIAKEYRETNARLIKESEETPTASLNWSDYVTGKIEGAHKGILSYTVTGYTFTGGAHGMTVETALNFDMKTGNLLTESDFFKEGYKDRLPGLLSSHLAESLENPSDTSMLFTQEIGPNGNFAIGEKGVTYIYNQYEIGPYVMGIIRVTVPWEELEGLY